MLRVRFLNVIVLTIFLPCLLGSKCEKETPVDTPPPPEYCGEGTGSFAFNTWGTIDTIFDCNTSGSFAIYLQPDIHDSFIGFNRLYFKLAGCGSVYRSNYVEFYSSDETLQQLEWGGSLPSGIYEMRGILNNIQLGSTCLDSIYRIVNVHLTNISITEFTNPQKVMQIEYFCQDSDTNVIDAYDVFLSPKTAEHMDIAFNVANTGYDLWEVDTDLPCSLVRNTYQATVEYIYAHKQSDDDMFLCGIKGFRDAQGDLLLGLGGKTIIPDTLYFTPNSYSGSLVAVKGLMNRSATLYEVDYNDLVTAITIHELGHQRGIHYHHDDFENPPVPFCVMNQGQIYTPFNSYSNPHFCGECITKIKAIIW